MGKALAIFAWACLLLGGLVSVTRAGVAPGTSVDNQAGASYSSAAGRTTSSISNVVQVITEAGPVQANMTLTKAVSTPTAGPGDRITFTLTAANEGAGDAVPVTVAIDGTNVNKIVVRDIIPDNTKFASFVAWGGSTPLYHIYGAAMPNYVTAAPSDISTIDAVAFALDAFPSAATASFKFSVTLNSNATGTVSNTAVVYVNNSSNNATPSNTVVVNATGPGPIIGFFTDGGFSRPAPVGSAGQPLYIQANAAACNANPVLPDTVQITVSALLSGDMETFTATETGPNTGLFQVVPSPPTLDASSNPVIPGNKIMEVLTGDTLTAVLKGCGSSSVNATLLIDPNATVFDSHSNQPVGGARVTLIDVTGQGNGSHPGQPATVLLADGVTPAASTVNTASNGRFQFLYVLPSTYKFTVASPGFTYPSTIAMGQLPAGRVVDSNASYGKNFVIGTAGPVHFDQPVDLAGSGLLLVEKSVDRSTAQIGDFLDYTIQVKNASPIVLTNVQISDTLPRGFSYQLGTTRIKAAVAPDPAGGKGPNLVFTFATITANSEVDITYRVQVGATAVMGANPNFVSATAGTTKSNSASATVLVLGGAFSNEGFVIGKVFADCNGNGKLDAEENGIPGVRVLLEDQTSAVTDAQGKYSIYGVAPLTHVVRIDPLTLPDGYDGEILNHRNAGDPNSMFVDMKNGQMFRADFATACSPRLLSEITDRMKKRRQGFVEAEAGLGANFTYDTIHRGTVEAKAAPSAGIVGRTPGAAITPAGNSPADQVGSSKNSSIGSTAKPSAPANANPSAGIVDQISGAGGSPTVASGAETVVSAGSSSARATVASNAPTDPEPITAQPQPEKTTPESQAASTSIDVGMQSRKVLETLVPEPDAQNVNYILNTSDFCIGTPTQTGALFNFNLLDFGPLPLSLTHPNVFFPTNNPDLANPKVVFVPTQQDVLSGFAASFKTYVQSDTAAKLPVVGHADVHSAERHDVELSQRRADLTKDALVSVSNAEGKIEMLAASESVPLGGEEVANPQSSHPAKAPDHMIPRSAATTLANNRRVDSDPQPAGRESGRNYLNALPDARILWRPFVPGVKTGMGSVLGAAFRNDGFFIGKAFAYCNGTNNRELNEPGSYVAPTPLENQVSGTMEPDPAALAASVSHIPSVETASSGNVLSTASTATESAPADPKPTAAMAQPEKTSSGNQPGSTPVDVAEQPLEPLETVLPHLDPVLGFINVKDNQVMPYTQTPVRVKGPVGSTFKLYVNDLEVGDKRVGKKVVDSEHQLQAWEFIGVELKPGHNSLRLVQVDSFGNSRGSALISLVAPKRLQKLRIDVPKQAEADGKTPVRIGVHLFDADNVPVMVPVEITLETTDGEWQVEDVDPRQPGVQVYVKGGEAFLPLIPPLGPGTAKIRISSGSVQSEALLPFVPVLRPMIAAGVVDEILSFRNFSGNSIAPVQTNDGFEEELRALSISNANGTTQFQSHVGLSLKGKVAGSYLLTLAYDSDKSNERLFRDIQPDEFYPVYGDSSVRSYDAQSTSRAYLRVDKGRSYVLYGDFATTENDPTRVLTVYNRSLTGMREHYQNDRVDVTAFASHDSFTQHVQEIPANGTSGPYILSNSTGVINGETVQLMVRDRNQPAVVLKITPETRFVDYEFEPYSGEILFTSPIPSFDQNLNPVFIRVTYEMDQGGARFWVAGVDGSVKVDDRVRVGGTYVADLNPGDQFFMKGLNSSIKVDSHTTLNGEFAITHQDTVGDGNGYHFELLHDSENVKARAYFGRTTPTFDNINSLLNQGRGEGGLKLSWKFSPTTRLVADAIRSEDTLGGGTQVGSLISVEHTLKNKVQVEVGMRFVEQGKLPASPSTEGSTNTTTTSIRTKVTVPVPHIPRLQAYGEYEQDVHDWDKKIAAIGGNFQLSERAKIYARHELISSLGNEFSLNTSQQQQATVFGIDGNYLKNTHVFSEYRGRDDFSGRETEAAIGLRNTWTVLPGLKLNSGIESVKVLKGVNTTNNLALTSGVDYSPTARFRGTSRFEWRASSNTRGYLSTLGAALKISQNWTFLGRNVLSTENTTSGPQSDQFRERAQMGFAFRDSATSSWNWLGMTEFRSERNQNLAAPTARRFVVLSSNVNYEPFRSVALSGRYASKFTVDKSLGLDSSAGDQLASLRLTYDLVKHWDLGFLGSTMFSNGFSSRQFSAGPELGRVVIKNLWASVGYNVLGYHDTDLSGENQMRRGAYVRIRFKFDERLLEKMPVSKPE